MILITGATGFIGQHLVARLIAQGERPRCLVRDVDKAATILPADKVELVQGATTRPETLENAVRGIDTIVHAAFMTADRKQSEGNHYEETNVGGTSNLILAAKAAFARPGPICSAKFCAVEPSVISTSLPSGSATFAINRFSGIANLHYLPKR